MITLQSTNNKTMLKKALCLFILSFACSCAVKHQPKTSAYAFAYFNNNGQDGLHLAYSEDGYNWKALKNDKSFLQPTVSKDKLMRDPCIIRGADGIFHMVWTVSWKDKGIGYATSPDLIHWSEQQFSPVMAKEAGAQNCWAPEITYDNKTKNYMIYWSTTITGRFPETATTVEGGGNHRLYYVTTKDFKTYSETKLLYNPGFNVIDATIVPDGNRFVLFMKDETREPIAQKNLKIAFAKNLTGPFTKASAPITGKYWAEGPTTLKVGSQWVVYFDKYTLHQYGAITSTDLVNWTDISDKITLPKGIRHGTVFTVSKLEVDKLLAVK